MLSEQLKNLTAAESDLLLEAIPTITVLIAGADHVIDQKESDWAAKLTHIRSFVTSGHNQNKPDDTNEFYAWADKHYHEKFDALLKSSPISTDILTQKLASLNPILAKLEHQFAKKLYHSFLSFAEHIAKASGGVLGFGSVSDAENDLIGLPMIHQI